MVKPVTNMVGPTISPGLVEPAATLMPTMVAGTRTIQDVLAAKNVHIAFVAVSG